jgi:hypothetical protein
MEYLPVLFFDSGSKRGLSKFQDQRPQLDGSDLQCAADELTVHESLHIFIPFPWNGLQEPDAYPLS